MTVLLWQPDTRSSSSLAFTQMEAYVEFKAGNLYKQYAKANPREAERIDTYWGGGARPSVSTLTGRALVKWADVYRGL